MTPHSSRYYQSTRHRSHEVTPPPSSLLLDILECTLQSYLGKPIWTKRFRLRTKHSMLFSAKINLFDVFQSLPFRVVYHSRLSWQCRLSPGLYETHRLSWASPYFQLLYLCSLQMFWGTTWKWLFCRMYQLSNWLAVMQPVRLFFFATCRKRSANLDKPRRSLWHTFLVLLYDSRRLRCRTRRTVFLAGYVT